MKLKYFLRGFGLGILFTTIMLAISFYLKASDSSVMTDEQIIEQAKKLGMVEKESITEENSSSETEQNITSSLVLPETSEQESEDLTESSSLEEESMKETETSSQVLQTESVSQEMTTAETTTEETITEVTTVEPEETTTQIQEIESNSGTEKVIITVESGMSSEDIAIILQEKGVITDASEFNRYLVLNKYANKMQVGTYEIPFGADYKTLAEILCN